MEFQERIKLYIEWRIGLPASMPFGDASAMRAILRAIEETRPYEEAVRRGTKASDFIVPDLSGLWCGIGQTVDRNIKNHKVHGITHLTEKEKVWIERCLVVGLTIDQLTRAAKALRPLERSIMTLGFRRLYGGSPCGARTVMPARG